MKPQHSGSNLYNYKECTLVILMAVVNANLRFKAIDVESYGKKSDSTIFRDSPLDRKVC